MIHAFVAPRGLKVIAASILFVAGCGGLVGPERISSAASPRPQLHVSVVRVYQSLAELKAASEVVIVATARSAVASDLNGIPVTVTQVEVNDVVAGVVADRTLAIQQLGSWDVDSPETAPLLRSGDRYLLMLVRFRFTADDRTGLWVILGDQGVFRAEGEDFLYAGADRKGGAPSVPEAIRVTDLSSLLAD
jgi:hypothetical protein